MLRIFLFSQAYATASDGAIGRYIYFSILI